LWRSGDLEVWRLWRYRGARYGGVVWRSREYVDMEMWRACRQQAGRSRGPIAWKEIACSGGVASSGGDDVDDAASREVIKLMMSVVRR